MLPFGRLSLTVLPWDKSGRIRSAAMFDGRNGKMGDQRSKRRADDGVEEFAEEMSAALTAEGLDPSDDKVKKTVAVCARVFGNLIADMGKTMSELDEQLKQLVARRPQKS